MSHGSETPFRGLIQIVITPFRLDGAIDFRSLRRLTADALAAGASALTVLGVSSEAAFVDEDERRSILGAVRAVNDGALPIVVGITGDETALVVERAREAREAGAAAVMLAPPIDDSSPVERYGSVAEAADGMPIILQDLPSLGHPKLTAESVVAIAAEVPGIGAIYHEDPPTAVKISAVRARAPDLPQIAGLGGLWMPWEFRAGATAVMTGFAVPRLIALAIDAALAGDWDTADRVHAAALPSIAWEAQPVVGLAHRKAMLVERGVIDSAAMRVPAPPTRAAAEAARLAQRLAGSITAQDSEGA